MKLTEVYLWHGKQMVKVDNAYNSWKNSLHQISQGSVLGPLIFNIFLYDLFCFLEGFRLASYVGDTTHYNNKKPNDLIMKETDHFSKFIFHWFYFNYIKMNRGKGH